MLPPRLRTAARLLRRPADWWVAVRTLAWMAVLPVLKRLEPLPELVRRMHSEHRRPRRPERELRTAEIVRGLCRTSGGNCLERSLILYRLLGIEGARPELVAGMGRVEGIVGHAWVEVDGRPLLETPEGLAPYVEVVRFGADGERAGPHHG